MRPATATADERGDREEAYRRFVVALSRCEEPHDG
jgi:hypothetical protein